MKKFSHFSRFAGIFIKIFCIFAIIFALTATTFARLSPAEIAAGIPIDNVVRHKYPKIIVPLMFQDIFKKIFQDTDGNNYIPKNTEKLGGKTANQILKRDSLSCQEPQKAIGVQDGKILCGSGNTKLVKLKIHSGDANINVVDRSNNKWEQMKPRDDGWYHVELAQITTAAGAESEIRFEDDSMLRLGSNTSIKIERVMSQNGATLAQAHYEHGLLWGRVLNADKLRFANEGLVVGVRGTSVFVNNKNEIKIIQSQSEKAAAQLVTSQGTGSDVPSCSRIFMEAGGSISIKGILPVKDTHCIGTDPIVANNTIKDIAYLNQIDPQSNNQIVKNEMKVTAGSRSCKMNGEAENPYAISQDQVCFNISEEWYYSNRGSKSYNWIITGDVDVNWQKGFILNKNICPLINEYEITIDDVVYWWQSIECHVKEWNIPYIMSPDSKESHYIFIHKK